MVCTKDGDADSANRTRTPLLVALLFLLALLLAVLAFDILLSLLALLVDVLLALALLLLAQRLLVLLVEVLLLFTVLLLLRRRLVALRRAVRAVLRLLRRVRVSLALSCPLGRLELLGGLLLLLRHLGRLLSLGRHGSCVVLGVVAVEIEDEARD